MKGKYRRLFHEKGIHDYCKITVEPKIIGYDNSAKYLVVRNPDGSRDFLDVTTLYGDLIYSKTETEEVHR
jgi:hypothetical protein